jgi:hypothetical protein
VSLTADELKLASYFFALRHDEEERELWACVTDDVFAPAARLMERAWLDRAWYEDEMLFRMSDEGYSAVELTSLIEPGSMN